MRRHKAEPISPTACECCHVQTASQTHHTQPTSQNGTDDPDNTVRVCHDCHNLYHSLTNQRLANTVAARVQNFARWLAQWPGTETELCGGKSGPSPCVMAPEWMLQEWADASIVVAFGKLEDHSDGRLSNLGKIMPSPFKKKGEK